MPTCLRHSQESRALHSHTRHTYTDTDTYTHMYTHIFAEEFCELCARSHAPLIRRGSLSVFVEARWRGPFIEHYIIRTLADDYSQSHTNIYTDTQSCLHTHTHVRPEMAQSPRHRCEMHAWAAAMSCRFTVTDMKCELFLIVADVYASRTD